jgi:hypothetical protein
VKLPRHFTMCFVCTLVAAALALALLGAGGGALAA